MGFGTYVNPRLESELGVKVAEGLAGKVVVDKTVVDEVFADDIVIDELVADAEWLEDELE